MEATASLGIETTLNINSIWLWPDAIWSQWQNFFTSPHILPSVTLLSPNCPLSHCRTLPVVNRFFFSVIPVIPQYSSLWHLVHIWSMSMMFSHAFASILRSPHPESWQILASLCCFDMFRSFALHVSHVEAYPWRDAALNLFVPLGPAFIAQVSTGCTRERGGAWGSVRMGSGLPDKDDPGSLYILYGSWIMTVLHGVWSVGCKNRRVESDNTKLAASPNFMFGLESNVLSPSLSLSLLFINPFSGLSTSTRCRFDMRHGLSFSGRCSQTWWFVWTAATPGSKIDQLLWPTVLKRIQNELMWAMNLHKYPSSRNSIVATGTTYQKSTGGVPCQEDQLC